MRLRLKILSGFFILALMLSIAGVWSIYELKTMGKSVQVLLDENYKSIDAAQVMIEALEREDSGVLLLLLGNFDEGRDIIESADNLFNSGFNVAANNITIPGEKAIVDSIKKKYLVYKSSWERPIVDTKKQGDLTWYFETVHNSFLQAKSAIDELSALNSQIIFETGSDLKEKANRAIMPGIVAIIAALIFTPLFNYFINYYFINPIIRINQSIKNFVKNRTPFDADIETNDEIAELAETIHLLTSLVHK